VEDTNGGISYYSSVEPVASVNLGNVDVEEVPVEHDIAELERKVRALQEAVAKLHDAKHAERLAIIIQKPGWTSMREHELVVAHVASLHSQVSGLHKACDALITIAEKIGHA
jgi:hypothetical protein